MKTTDQAPSIQCPKCGASIDVSEILTRRIEEGLRKDFDDRLAGERRRVEEKAAAERKAAEERMRKSLDDEHALRLKSMQEELAAKSEQVKELHRTKSEVERLRREKEEMRDAIEAELQRKMNEQLQDEKARIQRLAEERVRMKLDEKDVVIEQMKARLQEAQRKAEQGSMQLQGEVQELAIEEWLRAAFPLDTIGEVKKGARGADCLHTVNTRTRQDCGSIYYESKRTKDFQPGWIEKFKADMRAKGATIGVIVTEAMPKDMERMGMRDGVWVCNFEEFKGLSAVLRESVVMISDAVVAQENRGDKMTLLYDYLTGHEFRMQIEAIVEGFVQMETDLNAEKRAMEAIWKKREKQIAKVLLNTTRMHGAIRGIAGAAIPAVPQLGLGATAGPGDGDRAPLSGRNGDDE